MPRLSALMNLASFYKSRTFKIVASIALLQLTIAPGIQFIGWLYMIPTYALESGSIKQGLQDTFSGEKPCCFCKVASELNDDSPEQDQRIAKEEKPKKFPNLTKVKFVINTSAIYHTDSYQLSISMNESFIETPPPQSLYII